MEKILKGGSRTGDTAFSYQCNACNKCCYGKGIQVNPYESMRLSSFLRISTTEFRDNYLNDQLLKHRSNSNACIFLGEKGCTVHKHRPLVCRLYPLGMLRMADGQEVFTELTSHPDSAGEFGTASTVDGYLQSQEITPYLQAEKAYMELIGHMSKVALNKPDSNSIKRPSERITSTQNHTNWVLDPDPVIKEYCTHKGIKFPAETDQKLKLHLEALRSWADGEWKPEN